jgi:hypothetical protein
MTESMKGEGKRYKINHPPPPRETKPAQALICRQ